MTGEDILQQAKIWEDNRNWERAVDTYLELN